MIIKKINIGRLIYFSKCLGFMAVTCALLMSKTSRAEEKFSHEDGSFTVKQAIQIGLANNWNIKADQEAHKQAEAQMKIAQSQNGIQISANSFFSAGDMSSILTSSPGSAPPNINSVPSKGYLGQNLMLMAPLYTGGKLVNLIHAARRMANSRKEDVSSAQIDTAYRIRNAYYLALYAQSLEDVAQSRVNYARELVKNTQAEYNAGKGIQASVDRSKAELADAQRMLATERNEKEKTMLNLKTVMGISLDSNVKLSDQLEYITPTGNRKMWIDESKKHLPDLLGLKEQISSAKASESAVKSEYNPQIYGLVMANGYTSNQMGSGTGYTVGVTVSLPLFDNGQRGSELDSAKEDRLKLEARYRNLLLETESNVRASVLDLNTSDHNYQSALAAVQSAQSAYDVIALRVENNKGILVEQLDALTSLIQAKANLALALYQHELANAELLKAIGKI